MSSNSIKEIQKALNLQQDGIGNFVTSVWGKQTLHHFKRFKTIKRKLSTEFTKFTIIKIYGE